jgi:hypothetical protein
VEVGGKLENGAKAGVTGGRVGREANTGGVKVASIGAGQVKAAGIGQVALGINVLLLQYHGSPVFTLFLLQ